MSFFTGFLITDGYGAYQDLLPQLAGIQQCWQHVIRRCRAVAKLGPGSLQSWAADVIEILREAHRLVKEARARGEHKVGKHFIWDITGDGFTFYRDEEKIAAEARLDGIYVIRTTMTADTADASGVVRTYKNLKYVERDFKIIKIDDLGGGHGRRLRLHRGCRGRRARLRSPHHGRSTAYRDAW